MKKIILDTDFLVHCATAMVDYFSEFRRILDFNYHVFIIDRTMDELDSLIEHKKGKVKAAAKLAKTILKAKNVSQISTKKDKIVDDLIVEAADSNTIVATTDGELKRRLKAKGVSLVVLRQKKYLVFLP